jgi:hypothetical protein
VRIARFASVVAGGALLVSGLAACGGDDKAAEDQPVAASSVTSATTSATPSATPSPSPTLKPLSRFEDEPQVKVARRWAAGVARATTAGDRSARAIKPFTTPQGWKRMQGYMAEDMGRLYPGPLPFTPLGVRTTGASGRIPMCIWVGGFTLDPKTKQPDKAPRIVGADLTLKKLGGRWKVDDLLFQDFSCKKTVVKGRAF